MNSDPNGVQRTALSQVSCVHTVRVVACARRSVAARPATPNPQALYGAQAFSVVKGNFLSQHEVGKTVTTENSLLRQRTLETPSRHKIFIARELLCRTCPHTLSRAGHWSCARWCSPIACCRDTYFMS